MSVGAARARRAGSPARARVAAAAATTTITTAAASIATTAATTAATAATAATAVVVHRDGQRDRLAVGAPEEAATLGCAYSDPTHPEFDGGRFAWLDASEDFVVEPRGGRLLTFSGGVGRC